MTRTADEPESQSAAGECSRLRDQVRQLRQELMQAHQLSNLGTMVGMLSHECNNLLTPMVTYGRFALDSQDAKLMKKALEISLRQSVLLMKMSDRLLGMMVQRQEDFTRVNLRDVVEGAIDSLCRDPVKDGISIHNRVAPAVEVHGDANLLQQLIFNLLLNSLRALNHRKGTIAIAAEPLEHGAVRIRFRDTGCGISADKLPRIFDPFVSSKAASESAPRRASGLGLSICRMIVHDHGGTMAVESEVNVGTMFSIELPAVAAIAGGAAFAGGAAIAGGAAGHQVSESSSHAMVEAVTAGV